MGHCRNLETSRSLETRQWPRQPGWASHAGTGQPRARPWLRRSVCGRTPQRYTTRSRFQMTACKQQSSTWFPPHPYYPLHARSASPARWLFVSPRNSLSIGPHQSRSELIPSLSVGQSELALHRRRAQRPAVYPDFRCARRSMESRPRPLARLKTAAVGPRPPRGRARGAAGTSPRPGAGPDRGGDHDPRPAQPEKRRNSLA